MDWEPMSIRKQEENNLLIELDAEWDLSMMLSSQTLLSHQAAWEEVDTEENADQKVTSNSLISKFIMSIEMILYEIYEI